MLTPVIEDLWEEIAGLVKHREAALEPSEKGQEHPSPVGDTSISLVFRRRSKGVMGLFESIPNDSSCSVKDRSVFGLVCGDAITPLPFLPSGSS